LALLPSLALIGAVRLYQVFLGPFCGGRCRFHPSCSVYFIEAVRKYGAISGAARGVWRILRCHPWNAGGIDPP
jgi:putative membrane protein insertion efficiency factor